MSAIPTWQITGRISFKPILTPRLVKIGGLTGQTTYSERRDHFLRQGGEVRIDLAYQMAGSRTHGTSL